jgi:hypothetical protein
VSLSLNLESDKLFEYGQNYLSVEGYIKGHHLSGEVADVVEFSNYYSVGGVLYYNTPKSPWWASRFFLELSSVDGDGLSGYNVGVGFTLDF